MGARMSLEDEFREHRKQFVMSIMRIEQTAKTCEAEQVRLRRQLERCAENVATGQGAGISGIGTEQAKAKSLARQLAGKELEHRRLLDVANRLRLMRDQIEKLQQTHQQAAQFKQLSVLMRKLNSKMDIAGIIGTTIEFQDQVAQTEMSNNVLEGAIDNTLSNEEADQIAEQSVERLTEEIYLKFFPPVPVLPTVQQTVEVDELEKRLAELNGGS